MFWSRCLAAALASIPGATAFAQADFAVTWSSEPNYNVYAGDTITVSYDVENLGSSSASLSAGFAISDGVSAYLFYEDMLPTLSAGGYTSRTISFAIPSGYEGSWYAAMLADPFDAVVETDEMNNVYQFPGMLVIGGGTTMNYITVTVESLPRAMLGTAYSATLRQTGATAPTWYVSSGTLPSGLSLSTTGQISGTPTSPGTYTFSVTAEQAGYTSGSGTFTIDVQENQTSRIQITPTTLPEAHVGSAYEALITASGGVPPYGYQFIGAPAWLTTIGSGAEAGTVRGTPDMMAHYDLTLYVIDSAGADATVTVSLDVVESGALVLRSSLPSAVIGMPYSAEVASGGATPYTINVSSGNLPAGLAIDSARARIEGTPTTNGTFTFTVDVTDAMGATASGRLTIEVSELVQLEISSKQITVFVNADVNAPLTAVGGVEPYTWQMVGGSLPMGVSFDSASGAIVGKPSRVGMGTATFVVTDAMGASATSDVDVAIRLFRAGGNSGGSGARDGCTCITPSSTAGYASLLVLALFGVLLRRKRSA